MKTSKIIRKLWHDWYYKNASKSRLDFALDCQEVTKCIDLHVAPEGFMGRFRMWLHLSLCQACKNYDNLSKALELAVKERRKIDARQVKKINEQLVKKFTV